MVLKLPCFNRTKKDRFENDVKIYGIKTGTGGSRNMVKFENDVKIYGIKTGVIKDTVVVVFENDVKIYGIKTVAAIFAVGLVV